MAKNRILLHLAAILSLPLLMAASCGTSRTAASIETSEASAEEGASMVYFTKDISPEGLVKVYQALGVKPEGRVAQGMEQPA